MSLSLTQPKVMSLLAELHHIDADRPSAIRGRMSAFQRLGVPHGTNTGRGRPAAYRAPQLFELFVAFEMLQLGMTPERIAWLISGSRTLLRRTCQRAAAHMDRSPFANDRGREDVFLHLDPAAQTVGAGAAATVQGDVEVMLMGTQADVVQTLGSRRRCWINVSSLLAQAARYAQMGGLGTISEWKREFLAWGADLTDSEGAPTD